MTGAFRLERLPAVLARTGLSRSTLYRLVAVGRFPPPIKLSQRASAWDAGGVDRWIADRIASCDAKGAA